MSDDEWRAYPITSGLLAEILDSLMGIDGRNAVVRCVLERKAALNRLATAIDDVGHAANRLSDTLDN